MKVELIHITPNAEEIIEQAGRTAYLSFDKISADTAGKFVRMLIERGHESVLEHGIATFRILEVSRTMTHQLVRHRLCSFTQQSQRVVNEGDLKKYTLPPSIAKLDLPKRRFQTIMDEAFNAYDFLISRGISKEDARFVLPNACHTQVVVTANLRQWRHMIRLRGSRHTQWEFRTVIRDILKTLQKECPNTFFDLEVYEDDL
jgi:thymidylate synthase (FAD)